MQLNYLVRKKENISLDPFSKWKVQKRMSRVSVWPTWQAATSTFSGPALEPVDAVCGISGTIREQMSAAGESTPVSPKLAEVRGCVCPKSAQSLNNRPLSLRRKWSFERRYKYFLLPRSSLWRPGRGNQFTLQVQDRIHVNAYLEGPLLRIYSVTASQQRWLVLSHHPL